MRSWAFPKCWSGARPERCERDSRNMSATSARAGRICSTSSTRSSTWQKSTPASSTSKRTQAIEVRALADACVALVAERAAAGVLKLTLQVENAMPRLVANSTRLKQILLNLLDNAIKFTDPGGAVVLAIRRGADGGVEFEVRDTGLGMTAAEIEIALEPFGQVDTGLARNREGTGLGLPLARRLTELHGGALEIDSERGRGTRIGRQAAARAGTGRIGGTARRRRGAPGRADPGRRRRLVAADPTCRRSADSDARPPCQRRTLSLGQVGRARRCRRGAAPGVERARRRSPPAAARICRVSRRLPGHRRCRPAGDAIRAGAGAGGSGPPARTPGNSPISSTIRHFTTGPATPMRVRTATIGPTITAASGCSAGSRRRSPAAPIAAGDRTSCIVTIGTPVWRRPISPRLRRPMIARRRACSRSTTSPIAGCSRLGLSWSWGCRPNSSRSTASSFTDRFRSSSPGYFTPTA